MEMRSTLYGRVLNKNKLGQFHWQYFVPFFSNHKIIMRLILYGVLDNMIYGI